MSWILLTADVTEERALGQKLLKAAPQSLLDLLIRVVFCIVAFLIGSRIISFIRKLTGNALKRAKDVYKRQALTCLRKRMRWTTP